MQTDKKALHAKVVHDPNAGDYVLGAATKWWFEKNILDNTKVDWKTINCRSLFTPDFVKKINNEFDYLVVGGGGLFLPDSAPNLASGWQWKIKTNDLKKIQIPIYVISVGYNLFYGQKMGMPSRESNKFEQERLDLFKESVETLIDKSEYFSIRHNGDILNIKEVLDEKVHDKIKFQFCPSVEYCREYIKENNIQRKNNPRPIWAFEIKDDRSWRRYHRVTKAAFMEQLRQFMVYASDNFNVDVKVMFHDGSRSFFNFLRNRQINFEVINNTSGNCRARIERFMDVDVLFCMAGHSQMMGEALGCKTVSLISHNKLKYFLEDIGKYEGGNYVDVNNEMVYEKLIAIGEDLV